MSVPFVAGREAQTVIGLMKAGGFQGCSGGVLPSQQGRKASGNGLIPGWGKADIASSSHWVPLLLRGIGKKICLLSLGILGIAQASGNEQKI